MMRRSLILLVIFIGTLALGVTAVAASSPVAAQTTTTTTPTMVAGNYCVACHQADDPRLMSVTVWKGSIAREVNSPCPAATSIHEQLYYTERMLLMIDRTRQSVGPLSAKNQALLENDTQLYSRLLDAPVTSGDAFSTEAQTARYRLEKIYTGLNQVSDTQKQRMVLILAGLVTLVVLGSLVWGLYNTRLARGDKGTKPLPLFWYAVCLLLVVVVFTLPILRAPASVTATPTTDEQAVQTVLDTADRAASTADHAQAQAWIMARLGAAWNAADPGQAQTLFNAALASVHQAQNNAPALWGQSLAAQEAAPGISITMQKAELIGAALYADRGHAWSIPLIAREMAGADPAQAKSLLQSEQASLALQTGIYRDLELRSLALAWTPIDPSQAVPAARMIQDASIRAWTLREEAVKLNDPSLFVDAAEAARQVADPVQRARSLQDVAVVSGNRDLFTEAESALSSASGASLAYALSDLAAASGDESLVERIDPAYADARTAAWLGMEKYQAAWEAAGAIADPYERAHAQSAIASAWGSGDAALKIQVPLYRNLALRGVVQKTGDKVWIASIQSPYYKVQALTAVGDYQDAIQAVNSSGDSYPLVGLVAALAKTDRQTALSLVDEMSNDSDKAVALRVIAAATGDQTIFQRALGMALAARVSGDVLSPVTASLDLAEAFIRSNPIDAVAAFKQAYQTAQLIPTR